MRYIFVVSTFVVGVASGVIGTTIGTTLVTQYQMSSVKIEPHSEVISLLEDEVMSVVFRTNDMTFTAQRSKPAATFAVQVTYADGRPAQQCRVSPNLAEQLPIYSTITAKRQIQSQQQAEKDFPVQLGVLELRDLMENEPTVSVQLRTNSDQSALAALIEGGAVVEVDAPIRAFTGLGDACHVLAEG